MSSDVKSRSLFLPHQTFARRTWGDFYSILNLMNGLHRILPKQPHLSADTIPLGSRSILHRRVQRREQLIPFGAKAVKGTAFNQALYRTLIQNAYINACTKIYQRTKTSICGAYLFHAFDRCLSNVAHCREAESYGTAFNTESRCACIDVRRQNFDVHLTA